MTPKTNTLSSLGDLEVKKEDPSLRRKRRYLPAKTEGRVDGPGRKFGKLTLLIRAENQNKGIRWWAKCECGVIKTYFICNLRGGVKSCGCSSDRRKGKCHIEQKPEQSSWRAMWSRCTYKCINGSRNYLGRGISVCGEWSDFQRFYSDMGPKPTPDHTLDRIDGSKGYFKENCRWATKEEQANNTCKNRMIEHDGLKLSVSQWSRRCGVHNATLTARLNRGVPFHKAICKKLKN